VITRFQDDNVNRAMAANEWFEKSEGNITAVIKENWKTYSLPDLLNKIDDRVGGISDPNLFRSVIVLRNSQLRAASCVIDRGLSTHRGVENFRAWQYVEFFDPCSGFCNAERFLIVFLL